MKKILLLLSMCALFWPLITRAETGSLILPNLLQEDLEQLYADLKVSHIDLFVNVTQEQYNAEFESIREQLQAPLTKLQAHILFQRFVAFGKIAHANIGFPNDAYQAFRDAGGKAFPIYVEINQIEYDDYDKGDAEENRVKWFISEDYSSHGLQEGTEITHINGRTVASWLELLHQYIAADTPALASSLLEFQLPQYLWLMNVKNQANTDVKEVREKATITVLLKNQPKTLEIDYLSRDKLQQKIDAQASETSSDNSELREHRILAEGIGYLKPGPFYNAENPADVWNNVSFISFVDEAFEAFLANEVSTLVIDVRNNPGGTNSFSDPLISWFANEPFKFASTFLIRSSKHAEESNRQRLDGTDNDSNSVSRQLADAYSKNAHGSVFEFNVEEALPREGKRFKGDVIVLMDRSSYSNAVSLAAIVQDFGFGKVIGEPSADFATTYASMENFTLTHTGIEVGFPKAHIIRPSGDKKAGPVYPDVYLDEIDIQSVLAFINQSK